MRFRFLLAVLLYASQVQADPTGISVELADVNTDWDFGDEVREAQSSRIAFYIEDKTEDGLTVGGGFGYFSTRVIAEDRDNTERFDGEYLEIYLRKPVKITDNFALHSLFSYRYNTGDDGTGAERIEIQWSESRIELGFSYRFSQFKVTPYAVYYDVDGDIDGEDGLDVFDIDEPQSQGIRFDIFVEETAFIRLQLQSGNDSGGMVTFARRY